MHRNSLRQMKRFRDKYVRQYDGCALLDVGSRQYHGHRTYRKLFPTAKYTGMDIMAGPNVDLIVADAYEWREIDSEQFDVVISGQTFEHCGMFWLVFREMVRVLKPEGYVCVIAPFQWDRHGYPVDCWRFLPDGMAALGEWGAVTTLDAYLSGNDCVGVFRKGYGDDLPEAQFPCQLATLRRSEP